MFGLGAPEIIVILIVALVIFGPKKLPELGKSIGQGIREFKRGTQHMKDEMESSFRDEPVTQTAPKVAAAVIAPVSQAATIHTDAAIAQQPVAFQPVQPVTVEPVTTEPVKSEVKEPVSQG